MFKKDFYFIILLILLNIIAHFLPFGRSSLAPDDYVYLLESKNIKLSQLPGKMLKIPDRPVNYAVLMLQGKFTGDNPRKGFFLVFLSSIFVLLSIFYLFRQLFEDSFTAFVATIIFCLFPNKLETYHTPIFFNMNTVIGIYILSFAFFINFTKKQKGLYLLASLATYTIGIFWYEVGFFLPLVLIAHCFLLSKKKNLKYALYFFIPFIFYTGFRLSGVFGLIEMRVSQHDIGLSGFATATVELIHNFVGRYTARSILYGLYKFFFIEQLWLALIIVFNIFIISILFFSTKEKVLKAMDNRLLILAGIIFVAFLIPFFLGKEGGIGGRHTVLPSIGIIIVIMWLLQKMQKIWRVVFLLLIAFTLIISQGNAWAQVIACRINTAVYDTMKEMKDELIKADNIIVDTRSFADNIPFTWIKRDFNVLNTYYGAQTFEDREFIAMVQLILGDEKKSVYVATEIPKVNLEGLLEFQTSKLIGYRSVSKETVVLPSRGAIIIDFKKVYRENFNQGKRKK